MRIALKRRIFSVATIALLVSAVMIMAALGPFRPLDNALTDFRFRALSRPPTGNVVFVEIDGASLQRVGVWPWPRRIHAQALDKLMALGAGEVVFDIDFSTHSNPTDDALLAQALQRAGGFASLAVFKQLTSPAGGFNIPIDEFAEVHFYDGNRGPLYHLADKIEVSDEQVRQSKPTSWWYKAASGGGSLLDYLGYGATLGTWFMGGAAPISVTSMVDAPDGLEVDEHSITICRYATGLSKFETRWGTFTDPWASQPQPKCGFVIVGTQGTISSYDFEPHVTVQTKRLPKARKIKVDVLQAPYRGPIEYFLHCKSNGLPIEGPLSPALCRTAQRIVDTAALSAREKRTLELLA